MESSYATLTALADKKNLDSSFVYGEKERSKVAYNQFSQDIPVISLAGREGVDGGGTEICNKIMEACEDWGIFQIVDHGIDAQLVSDMTRLAADFFALTPEEKLKFDMTGAKKGGFLVSNHLRGELVRDWREMVMYFTYPLESRDYSRWPDKPAEWRKVTEQYSEQMMDLACKLLEVLAEATGLEKDALAKACVKMDQKVLINYYPKCPQPDLALGLHRHTDPGILTILHQDQVGGLQATRDGGETWITVQPVEGAFVVNIGDYGHQRKVSAEHRAVVNGVSCRMSIAALQNPAQEAIVYPLQIREGEESIVEEPIPFSEMYRRKMGLSGELLRLQKLAKENQVMDMADLHKHKIKSKTLEDVLT